MFDPKDIILIHTHHKLVKFRILDSGKIEIRAPRDMEMPEVITLLNSHQRMIQNRIKLRSSRLYDFNIQDGSQIPFQGKDLKIQFADISPLAWKLDNELLINSKLQRLSPRLVKDFYNHHDILLKQRAKELGDLHGFPPVFIYTKWYKSRWGSYSKKHGMALNLALIMAPQSVIDYVIIHEYCHIKHPNHSKAFWQHLAEYLPDYQKQKNWLKSNAYLLNLIFNIQ